ncbi:MAG: hydantoinase/oxoprolinase family protein, partial [Chloroflexi bacterium]|nr:hydantoinase/oxoprolinase family protein [Chloroflexota bacterium]
MKAVGIDIGGTFTDFISVDPSTGERHLHKVSSTPGDPSVAFMQGLEEMNLDLPNLDKCIHGSTVATNTIIQKKGATTGIITNKGFRDILEIARGIKTRETLYYLQWVKPKPLVPRYLRLEVPGRLDYAGRVIEELDEGKLIDACRFLVKHGVEAVAVCFLSSYVNPESELRAEELIKEHFPDLDVSISSKILPQWREYERTNTTVADAYVKPVMSKYFSRLEEQLADRGFQRDLLIMKSNGGAMTAQTARERPIETFLSGPAGGVVAGKAVGEQAGYNDVIIMDMGGTSFDVSLIDDGRFTTTTDGEVEPGVPIKISMIDIRTIGAGGGSIAWIDAGQALKVGPQSAGAAPGPACYGTGGTEPTVTDANLVLGRLNPDYFLGGRKVLQPDLAHQAVKKIADFYKMSLPEAAQGILDIAIWNMFQAIRTISAEKGFDPREFALVSGGGAGSLHAAAIARELSMSTIIVPAYPGVLSATGLLMADLKFDSIRSCPTLLERDGLEKPLGFFREMVEEGCKFISKEGYQGEPVAAASLDMRYEGQNWEINIPIDLTQLDTARVIEIFDREHERLYGFNLPYARHEIINLRVTTIGPVENKEVFLPQPSEKGPFTDEPPVRDRRQVYNEATKQFEEANVYQREALRWGQRVKGLAIIEEMDSTIYLPAASVGEVDR